GLCVQSTPERLAGAGKAGHKNAADEALSELLLPPRILGHPTRPVRQHAKGFEAQRSQGLPETLEPGDGVLGLLTLAELEKYRVSQIQSTRVARQHALGNIIENGVLKAPQAGCELFSGVRVLVFLQIIVGDQDAESVLVDHANYTELPVRCAAWPTHPCGPP